MKTFSCLLAFALVWMGCKSSVNTSEYQAEIDALENPESQSEFLEKIYDMDQNIRKEGNEITRVYGIDSKEQEDHNKKFRDTDRELLAKIKLYLDTHGHPKKATHTDKSLGTPYIVLHHAPNDGTRRKYYHYLHKAWQDGDIGGSTYAFFLNRFYSIEKGDFINWGRPFTEKDEIDSIHTALNLKSLKE